MELGCVMFDHDGSCSFGYRSDTDVLFLFLLLELLVHGATAFGLCDCTWWIECGLFSFNDV